MADKLTLDRQAMKNRNTAHLRIYVGGLIDNITEDEIYEHFIPYGQINGIVINRNFGFVQFETEQSAQDAIAKADGSVLNGKSISVRTAMQQRREPEVVTKQPEIAPAVALTDNVHTEVGEEPYDNFGNYIGDHVGEHIGDHVGDQRALPTQEIEEQEEDFPSHRSEGSQQSSQQSLQQSSQPRGRGRGARGASRGRGQRGRGGNLGGYRERSPVAGRGGGDWGDHGAYPQTDYARAVPVTERNDCEIIVVSKTLTEYAEYIEGRLKRLGIVVDLLYPNADVPIGKVLGNIASRGCLYAILVMPQNQENRSMTLTILHGLPQEHRNMPLEDALQLLSRNFQEVQRGGTSGREAVYALLGQLADGRSLTVLQYDKVIEYLQERREQQVKIELGEPLAASVVKKEVDLQQRILSILNEKQVLKIDPSPVVVTAAQTAQTKLLNDPTVRKALDSILQKLV